MQARSDAEPIRYDVEPLVTVRVLLMGELRRWAGRRKTRLLS